jgi:molecular chaperone IbpA
LKGPDAPPKFLTSGAAERTGLKTKGQSPRDGPFLYRFLEDALMRHFDLTPLYRSTVGFDRLASILDQVMSSDPTQNTYPPYNIEKTGDSAYRITIAVAGFAEDELSIESREGQLVVTGRKAQVEDKGTFLHRGIAARAFERRFQLADHVRAESAVTENGLLHIDLVREVPEALKPRKIEIARPAAIEGSVETVAH